MLDFAGLCSLIFIFSLQFIVNKCSIRIADGLIRNRILCFRKRLVCQMCHNYWPKLGYFGQKTSLVSRLTCLDLAAWQNTAIGIFNLNVFNTTRFSLRPAVGWSTCYKRTCLVWHKFLLQCKLSRFLPALCCYIAMTQLFILSPEWPDVPIKRSLIFPKNCPKMQA